MKLRVLKLSKKRTLSESMKSKYVATLFIFAMSFFLAGFNAQAAEANASQKAMKMAESQTQGKAVSSKFMQQGKKKGYKVRILKGSKISHVFISLEQVQ